MEPLHNAMTLLRHVNVMVCVKFGCFSMFIKLNLMTVGNVFY